MVPEIGGGMADECTADTAAHSADAQTAELFVADEPTSSMDAIAQGTARETAQDESLSTYAHRLTREDGHIDWTRSARQIHDQIRGLHPWPLASAYLGRQRIILRRYTFAATDDEALRASLLGAGARQAAIFCSPRIATTIAAIISSAANFKLFGSNFSPPVETR